MPVLCFVSFHGLWGCLSYVFVFLRKLVFFVMSSLLEDSGSVVGFQFWSLESEGHSRIVCVLGNEGPPFALGL